MKCHKIVLTFLNIYNRPLYEKRSFTDLLGKQVAKSMD